MAAPLCPTPRGQHPAQQRRRRARSNGTHPQITLASGAAAVEAEIQKLGADPLAHNYASAVAVWLALAVYAAAEGPQTWSLLCCATLTTSQRHRRR